MENCWDFVEWLGPDTSSSVILLLGDPGDLVRASAVSKSWRRFVIANGFCKKLCLTICPELSNFPHVIEVGTSAETEDVGSSSAAEWKSLEKEHRVYTYLSHRLVSPTPKIDFPLKAICASSTDHYPDESIDNTLEGSEQVDMMPSYWSSKGQEDPSVPETLTYRLLYKLCIIDEIRIRPFRAFFQFGFPIYSAKAVRFRISCSRVLREKGADKTGQHATGRDSSDGNIWDYVSPEFPMAQENTLQSFKLPRPFVCIGGALQVELLGRVQKQDADDRYYICVCHVQVIGRPLGPIFDAETPNTAGNLVLKYFPDARGYSTPPEKGSSEEPRESSSLHAYAARLMHLRGLHQMSFGTLLAIPIGMFGDDNDSDEMASD
ncbi:hypothetical protein J5N97_029906 [Dioscorea zingiberensis]|uniref:F-box protein n=1 Tax=Dioscorea zingiberensis TaxID=325984 RepID=A0A9D5BWP6_9LILI|nr:hypothetical protein J5N97_029906 [Dioscorea zingiberensis]